MEPNSSTQRCASVKLDRMKLVATEKIRLDKFLADHLKNSRVRIVEHIRQGLVQIDGQAPLKAGQVLRPGQVVTLEPLADRKAHLLDPFPMQLDIVYEDEYILIVNKSRGLVVHPGSTTKAPTLVNGLLAHGQNLSTIGGEFRPGIIHRLDKDTSGLMVVAKTDAAHQRLTQQIQSRTMKRCYVAMVEGYLPQKTFAIDAPLGKNPKSPTKRAVLESGKQALTHVKVLHNYSEGSMVACRLDTGRTHQIRVHLAFAGHPVIGDPLYGKSASLPLQLHSTMLELDHPIHGDHRAYFAPPPADFLYSDVIKSEEVENWL